MPEQIISASGTQFGLIINPDGSVPVSGIVTIGSVNVNVDTIFVQSGTVHVSSGNFFMVSGNNWDGVGSVFNVNAQSQDIFVVSGAQPFGFPVNEILRQTVGSPPTDFVMLGSTNSVMVDNLGSVGVFFRFDNTASTGSTSGFLPAGETRSFELTIGSISVLASGTASAEVQVFRLT